MKLQNIAAFIAIVVFIYAGYNHLFSKTEISGIKSIVKEVDSPLISLVKLDLSNDSQLNIYNILSTSEDTIYKSLIGKLAWISNPLYALAIYDSESLKKDALTQKEFYNNISYMIFLSKGMNLVKYYLMFKRSSVTVPEIPSASIYISNEKDEYPIGLINNVIVIGSDVSKVKELIISIYKSKTYNVDDQNLNEFENTKFISILSKNKKLKQEIIFLSKDTYREEDIENNFLHYLFLFVMKNSDNFMVLIDINGTQISEYKGYLEVNIKLNVKTKSFKEYEKIKKVINNHKKHKVVINSSNFKKNRVRLNFTIIMLER